MISGNPVFRFTFTHATEGVFIINEPIGWPDIKLMLERDEQFSSIIERFDGAFVFYGNNGRINGGFDIIRHIEDVYGADADLQIDADVSFDNGSTFESVYTGLYDFSENEETNNRKIRSAIIRNDFWVKFITRQETPVNIQSATSLDGDTVDVIDSLNIILTSQIIDKTTTYNGGIFASDPTTPELVMSSNVAIDAEGTQELIESYTQGTFDIDQDEIDDSFSPILYFVSVITDLTPNIELPDEGGIIDVYFDIANDGDIDDEGRSLVRQITMILDGEIRADSSEVDPSVIRNIRLLFQAYVQKNDETPIFLCGGSESTPNFPYATPSPGLPVSIDYVYSFDITSGHQSIQMQPGDRLTIFVKWSLFFNIEVGADTGVIKYNNRRLIMQYFHPRVRAVIQSTFKNTQTETFFVHDVCRSIIDRITGQNDSLTSDHLGNEMTSPAYDTAGCGSNYVNAKGLQIRNYSLSEKPFFLSFKDFWNGLSPILNLGLGYTNEQNKIEIARREDFFDPTISVYFSDVHDIIRRYDNDVTFNKIDIGYNKWQSESLSGIDDPQTKRSYATRFKKIGKPISIMSGFIAASLAIETTRRTTRQKSADYKYDDETFIIAVDQTDSTPAFVRPETSTPFSSITNLRHADTRYNSRITPARNFTRWIKYFNGALQKYLTSVYKFVAGEGNYDMDSDLNDSDCDDFSESVSEKQDLPVSLEYLHLPELFEIRLPMTWEQYKAVRNNRKQAIGISQTSTGHVPFFIKTLEYEPSFSKARILAWPRTPFSIQVIDFVQPTVNCQPACGTDGRYTEDSLERLTEDGQCREIE